ncbi:MAG TPA: PspC domain-containing protein [Bacteroidales bacterium]|nr:PspC domain-containing protein [Bacteroidales bacterium]
MAKRLVKGSEKWLFGVCSGIGNFFDVDPTIVRVLFVLFALFVGSGILAYIVLALLMPKS